MAVTCTYVSNILADFNGKTIKVEVPDGLKRSTVTKIMKVISDLPITTKSIEIKLSDGKVQLKISYEKSKIDIADSGNASDSDKEKQEPPEKSSSTIYKLTKDDSKAYKIGVNISLGLSTTSIPQLDFDKPENAGKEFGYIPSKADFINNGLDDSDVQQYALGDCWFLAPLAALADGDQKSALFRQLRDKVIMPAENNISMNGDRKFRFNFFRMGEWFQIVVDDKLPLERGSTTSLSGEWWVPLIEKAYATFNGSYDNIVGGRIGWGLTELTGGISTNIKLSYNLIKSIGINKFESFFYEYLNKNAICSTGNLVADGAQTSGVEDLEVNGLVTRHAYSILGLLKVETSEGKETLIRLRNPWGELEWNGKWSDQSDEWNHVKEDKRVKEKDDGVFYMSLVDWIKQFEMFCLCHVEIDRNNEQRVIGKLTPGINAALVNPNLRASQYKRAVEKENLQLTLYVEKDQDVWIQMLHETKNPKERSYVTLTIFKSQSSPTERMNFEFYKRSTRSIVSPRILPRKEFDEYHLYEHNGFCYRLTAGKYLMFAGYIVPNQRHYMIRVVGKGLTLKMLE